MEESEVLPGIEKTDGYIWMWSASREVLDQNSGTKKRGGQRYEFSIGVRLLENTSKKSRRRSHKGEDLVVLYLNSTHGYR